MQVDKVEFNCQSCDNEVFIDFIDNDGLTEDEIKFCPLCGSSYDLEMEMDVENDWELDPSSMPDDYDIE